MSNKFKNYLSKIFPVYKVDVVLSVFQPDKFAENTRRFDNIHRYQTRENYIKFDHAIDNFEMGTINNLVACPLFGPISLIKGNNNFEVTGDGQLVVRLKKGSGTQDAISLCAIQYIDPFPAGRNGFLNYYMLVTQKK